MCIRDSPKTVKVKNYNDSADELDTENDNENLRVLNATDMLSFLSRICRYSETDSEDEMFDLVDELKQFVENKVVQNCVQKKIRTILKRLERCYCRDSKRHSPTTLVGLYKKT